MKKAILYQCALMMLLTMILLWTVPATASHHEAAAAVKNVYVCGCCDMVTDQPGKAPCGMQLLEKQVLKEDADKLYVCACADGCKCGLNPADPTKCACGKELRAYPKTGKTGCAHGMQTGGGCDKPCCAKPAAEAK